MSAKNKILISVVNNKLLKNRIFISTKALSDNTFLKDKLCKIGAHLIEMPLIEIKENILNSTENSFLKNIANYNYIFFTSKNGITHFFNHINKAKIKIPNTMKFCCIGKKTELILNKYGYNSFFTSTSSNSISFGNDFIKSTKNRTNILLSLGNLANNFLLEKLVDNHNVDRINVYKTIPPSVIDNNIKNCILNKKYDLIIFTSPSAVNNFSRMVDKIKNHDIISIGQTTDNEIVKHGHKSIIVSAESSEEGILESIVKKYRN